MEERREGKAGEDFHLKLSAERVRLSYDRGALHFLSQAIGIHV